MKMLPLIDGAGYKLFNTKMFSLTDGASNKLFGAKMLTPSSLRRWGHFIGAYVMIVSEGYFYHVKDEFFTFAIGAGTLHIWAAEAKEKNLPVEDQITFFEEKIHNLQKNSTIISVFSRLFRRTNKSASQAI